MPVSDDDIIWAYRMLLGREPENQSVIAAQRVHADRQVLRAAVMASAEFQTKIEGVLPVGRHLNSGPRDIQTDCTPEQLGRMLTRISREWIRFGQTEPHWSVLTHDNFRGENIAAHEDQFYASGHPDLAQMTNMVRRSRPGAGFARALDFGCGVGRLSLALAEVANEVVGVDISPPHLALARARAEATGRTNVRFEPLSSVEDLRKYKDFDLVVTLIVLQHNPPPVMAELLRALLASLKQGGVAVFQIPTYLEDYSFSVDAYLATAQPSMEMNVLPQAVVFDIVAKAGCVPLEVREDGRMHGMPGVSHTFLVERS